VILSKMVCSESFAHDMEDKVPSVLHYFRDTERELIRVPWNRSVGVIGGAKGAAVKLGVKRTTLSTGCEAWNFPPSSPEQTRRDAANVQRLGSVPNV